MQSQAALLLRVHVSRGNLQKIEVKLFDKKKMEAIFLRLFIGHVHKRRSLGNGLICVPRFVNVLFVLELRFFLSIGVEVGLLQSLLSCPSFVTSLT